MTHSKKSERKEQREWQDLQNQKLAYMKRRQEEEETNKLLRNWRPSKETDDAASEQIRRDT